MRKSIIFHCLDRLSSRIQRAFSASMLSRACTITMNRINGHRCLEGSGVFLSEGYAHNAWQSRLGRSAMLAVENSLFFRVFSAFFSKIRQTSIGTYGVFGMLYGVFGCLFRISFYGGFVADPEMLFSLAVALLCVPWLHLSDSLEYTVRQSRVLQWFLFDVCGIFDSTSSVKKRGVHRYWLALLFAFLLGITSVDLTMLIVFSVLLLFGGIRILLISPELCAFCVILFFPFFSCFSNPTILTVIFVGFSILGWLYKVMVRKRDFCFGIRECICVLFALAAFLGGATWEGNMESVFVGGTYAILILFYFPARELYRSRRWRSRAVCASCISCTVVAAWGVFQYFFTDLELRWVDVSRFSDIGGRVCGPFTNPNIFAVFLLSSVPFLLLGVFAEKTFFLSRALSLIGFLMTTLCLILTWSRGAWLGFLVSVLLFLLCYSPRSLSSLIVSLFPLLAALRFVPQNVANRFSSIGSLSESSIRYRLYTWQGSLRMIMENIWGIGTGKAPFAWVYSQYAVSGTESVAHTHQLFLQIFTELGIQGFLVFLTFLGLTVLSFFAALRGMHGMGRGIALSAMCALISICVMGLFDYVWYHLGMVALFFALASAGGLKGETV